MQSRVEELEQQLQNLNDNLSAVTQEKQKVFLLEWQVSYSV